MKHPLLIWLSALLMLTAHSAQAQSFTSVDDLDVYAIMPWGERVIFNAEDVRAVNRLYVYDSTAAGLVELGQFQEQTYYGYMGTALGGSFFFLATAADASQSGIWVTDGTAAGTRLVLDNRGRLHQHAVGDGDAYAGYAAVYRNQVYYGAIDTALGNVLWLSDGMPGGERMVVLPDSRPEGSVGFSYPRGFRQAGGNLFFTNEDTLHGSEIWLTDGTQAGTRMAAEVNAGPVGSAEATLGVLKGRLYFTARAGTGPASAFGIYSLDSLGNDLRLVEQVPHRMFQEPAVGQAVAIGDRLYYSRTDTSGGILLAHTDGTPAGTGPDMQARRGDAISSLTAMGGKAYFLHTSAALSSTRLYSFDPATGTAASLGDTLSTQSDDVLAPLGNSLYYLKAKGQGLALRRFTPPATFETLRPESTDIGYAQQAMAFPMIRATQGAVYFNRSFTSLGSNGLTRYRPAATEATGIVPASTVKGIQAYPNPTTGLLTLALGSNHASGQAVLTDLAGQRLAAYPLAGPRTTLRLPASAQGTLLLEVRTATHTERLRLICR